MSDNVDLVGFDMELMAMRLAMQSEYMRQTRPYVKARYEMQRKLDEIRARVGSGK